MEFPFVTPKDELQTVLRDASEPYYSDEYATLYHGDANEIIPRIEVVIDLIVTDPPYGIEYRSNKRTKKWDGIAGDNESFDVSKTLGLAIRPLRRGRHLYVFGPNVFADLPIAAPTQLIWDKEIQGMGNLSLPWGVSHEPIWFGVYEPSKANRAKGYGNQVARLRKTSVLRHQRIQADAVTRHPTEKPVSLLRDLIEASSASFEIVLDPFAGSCSTLVAATLERRKSIGIEIEERYCEIAANRLRDASRIARQMAVV